MIPVGQIGLLVLAGGLVIGLAMVAIGAMRVARDVRALKTRVEGYADLPVLAFVERATRKVGVASRGIARAPALVYRARAARRELANAFAKMRAILTTPASLWRLGAWFVTGR